MDLCGWFGCTPAPTSTTSVADSDSDPNTPTSPTACSRACSCTSSDPSWVPVNDDLYAVRLLLSAACDQPGRGSRGTEPVSWE